MKQEDNLILMLQRNCKTGALIPSIDSKCSHIATTCHMTRKSEGKGRVRRRNKVMTRNMQSRHSSVLSITDADVLIPSALFGVLHETTASSLC